MTKTVRKTHFWLALPASFLVAWSSMAKGSGAQSSGSQIGREVAIQAHLQDGDEFNTPLAQLIDYGKRLFTAPFTVQEG